MDGRGRVGWLAPLLLAAAGASGCATLSFGGPQEAEVSPVVPDPPGVAAWSGRVVAAPRPARPEDGPPGDASFVWRVGAPLSLQMIASAAPEVVLPACRKPRYLLKAVVGDDAGDPVTLAAFPVAGTERAVVFLDALEVPSTFGARPDDATGIARDAFHNRLVPRLPEGRSTVRFEVRLDCEYPYVAEKPVVAEGHVDVEAAPGGVAAHVRKFGWHLPAGRHPEARKLQKDVARILSGEKLWRDPAPIAITIVSDAWEPVRDGLTKAVVARQIDAVVVTPPTPARPEVCHVSRLSFRKDAAGRVLRYVGYASDLGRHRTEFPCVNAR